MWVLGCGCWVWGFGFWILGDGFSVWVFGFWILRIGLGPLGAWKRVEDFWRPAPGGGLRFLANLEASAGHAALIMLE